MPDVTNSLPSKKYPAPQRVISVYQELRILLLAGLLIFSAGIAGVLYESSGDTVHMIAVTAVATISIACFVYGYIKKSPFSRERVVEKQAVFDFIILLGALTLLTTIAYLQFRFNFFGSRYGLATFIPMVLLFFAAYFYDHSGVLGMAITNLAAWAGIVSTQRAYGILQWEMSVPLISTGFALVVLFEVIIWASEKDNFKAHFGSVFRWSALNLAFISALTGLFNLNILVYTTLLLLFGVYFYRKAFKEKSFAQLLVTLIYIYIGCSYLFIRFLDTVSFRGMSAAYIGIFYFLLTAGLIAFILIDHHKKLRK